MSIRRPLAIVSGYAVLLFLLFWPVWFHGQMSGWDCAVEYWPDLVFQVRSIGHGHWPGWNPYALGGYPYWADPQTGLYHPASWLCWLGAAIGGDGPWLIQLKVLIGLMAALCGMHAWMWSRTRSHAAAAVAAVTFVLGSPLLVHKNGALLWPALYWPWLLFAIERFVAAPTMRRGALVGGALWLVGAAGHPQSFFYGLLVAGAYWVWLTRTQVARQWRGALVAIGVGAALLAATWVPAVSAVDESVRANRGLDYVLQQPLEPGALRELIVPNVDSNWMLDIYVGPLALIGAVWLCALARRRSAGAFWAGVAVAGVVLALGRHGHVLPFLAAHVPGFDLFRIAYRLKLVFGVAAAVLAGDVVASLAGDDDVPRWGRGLWFGLGVAWAIASVIVAWHPLDLALALAVVAAAGALLVVRGRARVVVLALVPALVLADLWHAGDFKLGILQTRPDFVRDVARASVMDGTDGPWRYHVGDMRSPTGGTVPYWVAYLSSRREESGYANPIEPQRHLEFEARAKTTPALLAQVGVKYLAGHGAVSGGRTVGPGIVALDDVAPIARWYAGAEVVAHDQVLTRMAAAPPSQTRVAFVEADDVRGLDLPAADAAPVDATLASYDPDQVAIDVDAPADGVLVLAEAYAPGWTAEVDGHDARVFRADYQLRAVQVPAGAHRVVFRYDPPGRTALPLLFVLGLLAGGLCAFGPRRLRWLDLGAPS